MSQSCAGSYIGIGGGFDCGFGLIGFKSVNILFDDAAINQIIILQLFMLFCLCCCR